MIPAAFWNLFENFKSRSEGLPWKVLNARFYDGVSIAV